MTNHQSNSSSLTSQSSLTMYRLIVSITILTSLIVTTTLCIPQQQTQRKSQQQQQQQQQQRDSPEDGPRTSADQTVSAGAQFQCPEQFGYYMDTRDCTKYYVCVFGEVLHESCTGGLRFSRELQTCDWPRNVECKQDNMTTTMASSDRTLIQESNVGSQQSADSQSSSWSPNQNEQATTGGQQATNSEENARPPKSSQMVFADEGSDPQQPSFDETVSPVITPDGTIHLHDGSGGTFGLGRAPIDSSQSVDVFVKPVASLAPVSGSSKLRQSSQQRPLATSTSTNAVQQQANTRQPQLSGSGEETSSSRSATGQSTTGADAAESGEQPTNDSSESGADNGAGESSTVESSATGEREELAPREGVDEGELEGESDDVVNTPNTGYVPPFSTTQHVASGSGRQQSVSTSPSTMNEKDGVSFDFADDGTVNGVENGGEGSGSGDTAANGSGDMSSSTHSSESQQMSPEDNEGAKGRRDEEEELAQLQPTQSQKRQNQTQSLHPQLAIQQKGLLSAPVQQTVAQNNRQSRMSNFQQQQQVLLAQQQHQLSNVDNRQQQVSHSFAPRVAKPTSGDHRHQHNLNYNDSSKIITFNGASHRPMELAGVLDESSSMQNDAAASFSQQQFPSPRSQSLLFSERPFASGGASLSTSADRGRIIIGDAPVTLPTSSLTTSARQSFVETSEPLQSFITPPRRPRPPKRQQIPSGGVGTSLPANSFRPANFSSSSSSSSSSSLRIIPHHHPSPSTGSAPGNFLVSREPPTTFVESDALAGGPPLMMMRGPPSARTAPNQRHPPTSQPRASSTPSGFQTGTGSAPGSRRPPPLTGSARHFSELAAGSRNQGQQQSDGGEPLSPIFARQTPSAMTTAARPTGQQQQARRVNSNQLQVQLNPGAGFATTNLGSASLIAPTPPTITPPTITTTTTTTTAHTAASTGATNPSAGSELAATTGATQQEQDPQLVANRYLNSAIDALEAGQPFGAVDYDFEILDDNLSDRRNPTSTTSVSAQQQRSTTHQARSSQRLGSQSSVDANTRARQVQSVQQLAVGAGGSNRSALLFSVANKQMDLGPATRSNRLREEEAGGGGEEERVSLANGQPVAERPAAPHHATSGSRTGQQLPAATGRHSFSPHSSKPLPSSQAVLSSAIGTGAQLNQQQPASADHSSRPQPTNLSSTKKPRPTNKKIIVDHEQALANNRASVEPARRPEPLFATPTALQTATKCDNRLCKLPDCKCGDTLVPAALDPKTIPQVVLLTFDDAVNELNWEIYEELFTGRTNPNGCPILATFYVSHEWTDYGQVQTLYSRGHEIASHSVTHSFGEKFSKNQWFKEVNGQREILNMYGGVKINDVRGMRAPFLQIGGNKMFEMLYDANFTYDSSMPIFDNLPPMWPYTLDYQLSHECMITPCPTKSFPGVWEVGMTMWVDLRGGRCSMGDACSNPADEDGVHEMLMKNFNRHYKSNRAPFGLFYHSAWFNTVHHRRGFIKFLGTVNAMPDVFFVTNWQMLQWMRKPTPLREINSFEPWQCPTETDRPPPCSRPSVCNVKSEHGTRFMKTCQPCPANHQYPWVGATGFKGKQASLSGSG